MNPSKVLRAVSLPFDPWDEAIVEPYRGWEEVVWCMGGEENPEPQVWASVVTRFGLRLWVRTIQALSPRTLRAHLQYFSELAPPSVYRSLSRTTHQRTRHRMVLRLFSLRYGITCITLPRRGLMEVMVPPGIHEVNGMIFEKQGMRRSGK